MLLVAFMKLFLEDGFVLEPKDCGLPREHGIDSGAVIKYLQRTHSSGTLNDMIQRRHRLLQTPTVPDPTPGYT
ncbi:hypothetical protein L915_03991 [Phytophthora nicotianae]|uniref:Uncharacterized protein n=1 Tax=Phytophthora nicotianae TaxID=4792 RepID=W2HC27_PHYNI|nr:hypothetical protein L915_03991 [Phytophthora nicotianae]